MVAAERVISRWGKVFSLSASATRRPVESLPPEMATRICAGLRIRLRKSAAASSGNAKALAADAGMGSAGKPLFFAGNLGSHGLRSLRVSLGDLAHGCASRILVVECRKRHAELQQHFRRLFRGAVFLMGIQECL